MVSSIDGATQVDGKSKPLSSDIDRECFHAMRSLCDVVLVGASTVKIEGYKPVVISSEVQAQRKQMGQLLLAPIAVVTNHADFDFSSPFFTEAKVQPIIFTNDVGEKYCSNNKELAELVNAGKDEVDLKFVKENLAERGFNHILCEGGPTLNASLLEAEVVDELCLTISPQIAQGDSKRIFNGVPLDPPKEFMITNIYKQGDVLLFRYKRNI